MPRKSEKNTQKDYIIYCIFSAETHSVFISSITREHDHQVYKDHVRGEQALTKELFNLAKKTDQYPGMYLLEEVHKTKREAYCNIIVWTKYFLQHGYNVLARQKTLDYAADLSEENQMLYQKIKELPLENIIHETRLLHRRKPRFKAKIDDDHVDAKPRITVLVTQDEHRAIQEKAQDAGLSMSKYCHDLIVNQGQPTGLGAILQVSFFEYSEELKAINRTLRTLQLEIYQRGNYLPQDLQLIENKIEQVNENYKKVIRYIERQFKKLR